MKTDCLAPADLLFVALDTEPGDADLERHLLSCAACRRELDSLSARVIALRSLTLNASPETTCLDEDAIAEVVDGFDPVSSPGVTAHLVTCAQCRKQVATVARLLRSSPVAAEVQRLERINAKNARSRNTVVAGLGAGLAAAALAAVMLWPSGGRKAAQDASNASDEVFREGTITTTAAPRALAPIGAVAAADTLVWTAVPHADRYRITVFDRDGAVLLDDEVTDTTLAFPTAPQRASGGVYLWRVEARTGWDRWVPSELVEFTVRSAGSVR